MPFAVSDFLRLVRIFAAIPILAFSLRAAADPATIVPATAPRTNVLAGRAEAFRTYCLAGVGAKAFALKPSP